MFYLAQILMTAFAFFISNKEATAVKMMRDYVPTPNPFAEPFHFYGYSCSVIVGVCLTAMQTSLAGYILTPLVTSVIYWSVFDWELNNDVYKKWNRIGRTAWIDRKLWEWFGKDAERNAVIMKVSAFFLINIVYLLIR